MGKAFEAEFAEPCQFYPHGWHVSRNQHDRTKAAELIKMESGLDFDPEDLKESWVRFQFAPEELRYEYDSLHCWLVVPDGAKNAQPTWAYEPN